MIRPRIELGTFCVLSRCHDQLDHRTNLLFCKKSTSSLFLLLFLMFALFPNRVISLPLFPLVLISLFYVKPPLILPFGRQASLTQDCSSDYRHPKYI